MRRVVAIEILASHPSASDAHGHNDVAIAIALVGEWAHLSGGLLVLKLDADGSVGGGGEKIEHVAGIETDGDGVALVFLIDGFLGFAVFRAGRRDFHTFWRDSEFHGMRALVSKLGDAAHGVG